MQVLCCVSFTNQLKIKTPQSHSFSRTYGACWPTSLGCFPNARSDLLRVGDLMRLSVRMGGHSDSPLSEKEKKLTNDKRAFSRDKRTAPAQAKMARVCLAHGSLAPSWICAFKRGRAKRAKKSCRRENSAREHARRRRASGQTQKEGQPWHVSPLSFFIRIKKNTHVLPYPQKGTQKHIHPATEF